jgi:hypothetical protein
MRYGGADVPAARAGHPDPPTPTPCSPPWGTPLSAAAAGRLVAPLRCSSFSRVSGPSRGSPGCRRGARQPCQALLPGKGDRQEGQATQAGRRGRQRRRASVPDSHPPACHCRSSVRRPRVDSKGQPQDNRPGRLRERRRLPPPCRFPGRMDGSSRCPRRVPRLLPTRRCPVPLPGTSPSPHRQSLPRVTRRRREAFRRAPPRPRTSRPR